MNTELKLAIKNLRDAIRFSSKRDPTEDITEVYCIDLIPVLSNLERFLAKDNQETTNLRLPYDRPPYDWPKGWPFPLPEGEIVTRDINGKWIRKLKIREEYDDWEKHS